MVNWRAWLFFLAVVAFSVLSCNRTQGMVPIHGASFLMGCVRGDTECYGDEAPQHQVRLSSFYIDAHEVTNQEYRACVRARKCPPLKEESCWKQIGTRRERGGTLPAQFHRDDRPAVCVSWETATAYCAWKGRRLPTETEWEFAVRGGANSEIRHGDLEDIAWYGKNAQRSTQSVGQKKPNAFGLYDMLGNVWEWCADWYDSEYYSSSEAVDPAGPKAGTARVARGGGWSSDFAVVRASARSGSEPDQGYDYIGFGCARDAD